MLTLLIDVMENKLECLSLAKNLQSLMFAGKAVNQPIDPSIVSCQY
jgi:hypothetical protein